MYVYEKEAFIMKKWVSLFLTFFIAIFCTFSATAEQLSIYENEVSSSETVSNVKTFSEIPEAAKQFLESRGSHITTNTLVQVLPIIDTNDTAICLTNTNGNTIERDVYIAYVEDEDQNLVVDNSLAEVLAQGPDYGRPGSYPSLTDDGRYIVHAVATSALYENGIYRYYKPYKCQFYYNNYAGVTVNSIKVQYIADGFLYSYPGFKNLGEEYVHSVIVNQSNPIEGYVYGNTNYFVADKVLMTDSGSPTVGHYLTFTNVVNGVSVTYTLAV